MPSRCLSVSGEKTKKKKQPPDSEGEWTAEVLAFGRLKSLDQVGRHDYPSSLPEIRISYFIHIYYLSSWAPASVENLSFVGFLNFVGRSSSFVFMSQQSLWYSSSTMTLYFFRQRAIMTRKSLSWIKVIFLKSKLVASELGKLLVFATLRFLDWTDFCWIAQLLHHHHQSHCLELTTSVEIEFSDGLVGTLILSMRVRGAATTSSFWKNVNRSTSSDNVLIINLSGQWAKRQAHSKHEPVWGDTQKVTRQESIFLLPATLPSSTSPSSTIVAVLLGRGYDQSWCLCTREEFRLRPNGSSTSLPSAMPK